MKNSVIEILASVVMMITALSSCESSRVQPDTMTLELTVEAPHVKSFFSTGESQVKWGTGDIISLVDDKGFIHDSEPLAKAVLGEAIFVFPDWPSDCYPLYAIHSGAYNDYKPFDTFENGVFHSSVESLQIISRINSFSRSSLVTVGTVKDNQGKYSVLFKNICALVKISVKNDREYSSIVLAGTGEHDALSGKITIVPGETSEDYPTFSVLEGVKSVTLSRDSGNILTANYYLCVLPGTVVSPILTYCRKDGSYVAMQYNGNLELHAGKITDLSDLDGSWTEIKGVQAGDLNSEIITSDNPLKVCSYNVWSSTARKSRIETGKDADGDGDRNYADPVHYWNISKEYIADNMVAAGCDIYALQECCDSIKTELPALLSSRGCDLSYEYDQTGNNQIMWKDGKIENLQCDKFSSTPFYIDSNGELHIEEIRTCIWAKMRVRTTGEEFFVFNTHGPLDDSVNVQFAKEIVKKVAEINTSDLPVFVLGDFNAGDVSVREGESGMMYDYFLGYWTDSYKEALKTGVLDGNELSNPGTHVGYMDNTSYTRSLVHKIDHIFYKKLKIVDYYVSRKAFSKDGIVRYPSDHLPVCGSYIFEK